MKSPVWRCFSPLRRGRSPPGRPLSWMAARQRCETLLSLPRAGYGRAQGEDAMGGARAAAPSALALCFGVAGCGIWHENIYPHVSAVVVIPPAPAPIDAPPDMPAFD